MLIVIMDLSACLMDTSRTFTIDGVEAHANDIIRPRLMRSQFAVLAIL